MIKKILSLLFLTIFVSIIYLIPYFVYFLLYNQKLTHFYKLPKKNYFLTNIKEKAYVVDFDKTSVAYPYHGYHVSDYVLKIPTDSPLYLFIPAVSKVKDSLRFGLKISSHEYNVYLELYFNKKRKLNRHLLELPLFKFPYIRNYLEQIPLDKIWADLYQLKLLSPDFILSDNFFKALKNSPFELLYQLYILYMRALYLPEDTEFVMKSKIPNKVILKKADTFKDSFQVLIFEQEHVYSMDLKHERINSLAESLSYKIIEEFEVRDSYVGADEKIYQEFKSIKNYALKKQDVAITLFSILSHKKKNLKALIELVTVLEKSHGNLFVIESFFEMGTLWFGKEKFYEALKAYQESLKKKSQGDEDSMSESSERPEKFEWEREERSEVEKNVLKFD